MATNRAKKAEATLVKASGIRRKRGRPAASKRDRSCGTPSKSEISAYALFLLGGISRPIHTEDIALRCFGLAPDLFSWVRYPQYPDKDIVRASLAAAKQSSRGALVTGRSGRGHNRRRGSRAKVTLDGWILTEIGVRWVKANRERLAKFLGERAPDPHRQDLLRKAARIRNHPLFRNFLDQPEGFVPPIGALADLFRCRVDSEWPVWERRLETLRNEAYLLDQEDVLSFLDICRRFVISATGGPRDE